MKKIISISLILIFFIGNIDAQNDKNDFNRFYKTYKEQEGVVSIYIPGLVKSFIKDELDESEEIIKKTKSLRILTTDNPGEKMIKDLEKYFSDDIYALLMLVKDGKETVAVKAKQNEKTVEEILFIIQDHESLTVLCMKGKYNLEDALDMGNKINID